MNIYLEGKRITIVEDKVYNFSILDMATIQPVISGGGEKQIVFVINKIYLPELGTRIYNNNTNSKVVIPMETVVDKEGNYFDRPAPLFADDVIGFLLAYQKEQDLFFLNKGIKIFKANFSVQNEELVIDNVFKNDLGILDVQNFGNGNARLVFNNGALSVVSNKVFIKVSNKLKVNKIGASTDGDFIFLESRIFQNSPVELFPDGDEIYLEVEVYN